MPLPRYRQLADLLRADIATGRAPLASVLPSELELCEAHGVSRHTVREALRLLHQEGLVERRRRAGTTVIAAEPNRALVQSVSDIGEVLQYARGAPLHVRSSTVRELTAAEAALVREDAGEAWRVVDGYRLRGAERSAVAMIYIAPAYADVAEGLTTWPGPIHDLIAERHGVAARRITQEITAEPLTAAAAKRLQLRAGDASLRALRRYYGPSDRLMLVSDSLHAPRFVYASTFSRGLTEPFVMSGHNRKALGLVKPQGSRDDA